MRGFAGLLVALALSGCANFKVVSEFAAETSRVTGTVRTEMQQMSAICEQQALVLSVLTEDDTDKRIDECKVTDKAMLELQKETLNVLDLYAATLLAMADDKNFDISAAIESTTKKLGAIKNPDGKEVVKKEQIGALTKVLNLLGEVVLQAQREEGIRKLVAAGPELIGNVRVLRSFFASEVPPQSSDYKRLVRLVSETSDSLGKALRAPAIAKNEPIRATEHRMALRKIDKSIALRKETGPDGVGTKMVAAIDAWIEAVPVFQREALQTDPKALYARIKALRAKSIEARDAVDAAI